MQKIHGRSLALYPKYPHVNMWVIIIWGSVTIKVIATLLHSPVESANNKEGGGGGGSIVLILPIFQVCYYLNIKFQISCVWESLNIYTKFYNKLNYCLNNHLFF